VGGPLLRDERETQHQRQCRIFGKWFQPVAQYQFGFQSHVTRDSGGAFRISFGRCANITLLVQNDFSL
jgi:hypothetical protein